MNTARGYTRLQLSLMQTHVETALRALDEYELDITDNEKLDIEQPLSKAKDVLDRLLNYVDTEIEIEYLNEKLEKTVISSGD